MATQIQNEAEVYLTEKQLLAEARNRRLAGHAAKKQARQVKFGNNRLELAQIEDAPELELEVNVDDDGDIDWKVLLQEVNSD